jgi:hypothetical protein
MMNKLETAMKNGQFDHDAKTLKVFANQAIAAYGKGRDYLHYVACCLVNHAVKHDGGDQLAKFLEDMGSRSQTRHRIAAWVRHHARYEDSEGKSKYAMIANINDKGEVRVKLDNKEKGRIDVAKMFSEPYWDVLDIAKVKTNWELENAVKVLVRKAVENGIEETDIKSAIHVAYKAAIAA